MNLNEKLKDQKTELTHTGIDLSVQKCIPFSKWIKMKLKEKKISQAELAREMNVNRSTINLWTTAKRIPSSLMKEKIKMSSLFSLESDEDHNLKFLLWCCHLQELNNEEV